MEHWFNDGVADGFNLMPPTLPGSLEDFVEYIVPELQKRNLYRHDYTTSYSRDGINYVFAIPAQYILRNLLNFPVA